MQEFQSCPLEKGGTLPHS